MTPICVGYFGASGTQEVGVVLGGREQRSRLKGLTRPSKCLAHLVVGRPTLWGPGLTCPLWVSGTPERLRAGPPVVLAVRTGLCSGRLLRP